MTESSDYLGETTGGSMGARGAAADEVFDSNVAAAADLVRALRELSAREAPAPSPQLEVLLANGVPVLAARRRRRIAASVALGGALSVAVTGVAAATDSLPGQSHDVITRIIHNYAPFGDGHPAPPATPAGSSASTSPAATGGSGRTVPIRSGTSGSGSRTSDGELPSGSSPRPQDSSTQPGDDASSAPRSREPDDGTDSATPVHHAPSPRPSPSGTRSRSDD